VGVVVGVVEVRVIHFRRATRESAVGVPGCLEGRASLAIREAIEPHAD